MTNFDLLEDLFWKKAEQRLKDDKPLSDSAMARMLEYFRAKQEKELAIARADALRAEQEKNSNPVQTIMSNTGIPIGRRVELLEQARERILSDLKECENAIEELK